MTFFKKLSQKKQNHLTISDKDLSKFDANSYPLGVSTARLRRYPSLKPKTTLSISTEMKNKDGHRGLLVLGTGGVGKTVLANTVARKAHLAEQQIIRYYQHECELELGEGTSKFTDVNEFDTALSHLDEMDSIVPTIVIIDSIESYLTDDEKGKLSANRLNHLLSLKTRLEARFTDKILFIFVLKGFPESEVLSLLYSHVALTVTGRVYGHYEIGKLLNDSASHLFYMISELKPGEFVVVNKELSSSRKFSPTSIRAFSSAL